jgi:hypothetical protein
MSNEQVNAVTRTQWLPREGIWINPKVAWLVTEEDIKSNIPWDHINKSDFKDVYGVPTRLSTTDPVANLKWDYLWFRNVDYFRPAAIAWTESYKNVKGTHIRPSYTGHLKGTVAYKNFWKEEARRIMYGYEPVIDGEPCGLRITGEFYFYLNYAVIQKIWKDEHEVIHDETTFPDFLAMDYYYFKEMEARDQPGLYNLDSSYKQPMIVAKSRRKGFEQPLDSLLWSNDGPMLMGDVKVGSEIFGPNGKLLKVLRMYMKLSF